MKSNVNLEDFYQQMIDSQEKAQSKNQAIVVPQSNLKFRINCLEIKVEELEKRILQLEKGKIK